MCTHDRKVQNVQNDSVRPSVLDTKKVGLYYSAMLWKKNKHKSSPLICFFKYISLKAQYKEANNVSRGWVAERCCWGQAYKW